MTDSPSEDTVEETVETDVVGEALTAVAGELADLAGADSHSTSLETIKLFVDRDRWVEAIVALRGRLPFFSWLSAIDWSKDVQVGEPAADIENLDERYEVLCRMSSVTDATGAVVSTTVPKNDPWLDSLTSQIGGADWHEREAAEMFGIDFRGHPNLTALYLPDSFVGHPLRKSYPLLSREVKPWPGTVDVEGMPGTDDDADGPSTTNAEAGDS